MPKHIPKSLHFAFLTLMLLGIINGCSNNSPKESQTQNIDQRIKQIQGHWIATKYAFAAISAMSIQDASKITGAKLGINKTINISWPGRNYTCDYTNVFVRENVLSDEGIFAIDNKGSMKPEDFNLDLTQQILSFEFMCENRQLSYFVYLTKEDKLVATWDGTFFLFKRDEQRTSNECDECIETVKDGKLPNMTAAGLPPEQVALLFCQIKCAVINGDANAISRYVLFPVWVNIDGNNTKIDTPEIFVKNYEKIFNNRVRLSISEQKVEDIVSLERGAMIGGGEL